MNGTESYLPYVFIIVSAVVAAFVAAFVGAQVAGKTVADKLVVLLQALHDNGALQSAIDALYNSVPADLQSELRSGVAVFDKLDQLADDIVTPSTGDKTSPDGGS